MTTIRDFQSAEQPGRMSMSSPQGHRLHHHNTTPNSPISPDDPSLDRRGSMLSAVSTTETNTIRHRKPNRSNTVTSYHAMPEHPALHSKPGAEPGIDTSADNEHLPPNLSKLKAECDINIFDFSDEEIIPTRKDNASLAQFLEEPRPENTTCRWISVNGLSWDVIKCIGNKYHLHRLAIEDLIYTHTRTKVDWYADHAFVCLTLQKLVRLHQHSGSPEKCDCSAGDPERPDSDDDMDEKFGPMPERRQSKGWWSWLSGSQNPTVLPRYEQQDTDGRVSELVKAHSGVSEASPIKPIRTLYRYESAQIPEHTAFMERHGALAAEELAVAVEQVSMFLLADNTIISFFEHSAADVEIPILERLHSKTTMLRRSCDASLMLQAIIDAIVDLAMPVRDAYNKARKELQIDAMTNPDIKTSRKLHIFGEEIDMLQNLIKPIVHLVNAIRDHNSEPLAPAAPIISQDGNHVPSLRGQPNAQVPGQQHSPRHMLDRKISEFRRTTSRRPEPISSVSITQLAHTYFGDVLDHCITMIQVLEQMDASAQNITSLIFNTVGARTNSFMMILAVVTVFFAPLTFVSLLCHYRQIKPAWNLIPSLSNLISGYFGMNFSSGAGLAHPFAFFWVVGAPSLVGFMLLVFGYMLRDRIKDAFAKRGIKAHRKRLGRRR